MFCYCFFLTTLLKGSKGGHSNTCPALLFVITVNINVPSEHLAPSEHFAGLWFPPPSSVLLALRAMAHLCQTRWFGIWLHALCLFSFLSQSRERSQTGTWYWVLLIAKGRNNLQQVWHTAAASTRCISWCTAVVKHRDAFELFVFLQDTKHFIMRVLQFSNSKDERALCNRNSLKCATAAGPPS